MDGCTTVGKRTVLATGHPRGEKSQRHDAARRVKRWLRVHAPEYVQVVTTLDVKSNGREF